MNPRSLPTLRPFQIGVRSVPALAAALVATLLAGCSTTNSTTPPPLRAPVSASASSTPTAPHARPDAGPAEAHNLYLQALALGDVAAIRSFMPHGMEAGEQARFDGMAAVLAATARVREAFAARFGAGRLGAMTFHCTEPGTQIPTNGAVDVQGDRAAIALGDHEQIRMMREDGVWKEYLSPWSEAVRGLAGEPGMHPMSVDCVAANLTVVARLLEQTASEARGGTYLSFEDAWGTLNARLRGLAGGMPALFVAHIIDQTGRCATLDASLTTVPLVQLRGGPAELGTGHARELGARIKTVLREYMTQAFRLQEDAGQEQYRQALQVAAAFEPFLRPEHREELHTLATGAGIDFPELMLGQCFADLNAPGGCSTIALPAEGSRDRVARLGRNLDYRTYGVLDRNAVLLVFHPQGRLAFASAAAPGLAGVLSGMNEAGLTVAVMEVPRIFRRPEAMPYMLLYRTVLENCRTVAEALALLERTPRQSANNLMLMDAAGDRAVAELTPEGVTVRRAPRGAALISTNHQRGEDLDTPQRCHRFDYLHDAARRGFGRLDVVGVEELLSGASQTGATFQSMVFEPTKRRLHLAVGPGTTARAYMTFELATAFR